MPGPVQLLAARWPAGVDKVDRHVFRSWYPVQLHPGPCPTTVEVHIGTAGANRHPHPADHDTGSCLPPFQDSLIESQQQSVGVVA